LPNVRVKVNGVIIDTPVILVTEADRIVVDGNAVEGPDEPRLFRYHKPSGLVTTNRDEIGARNHIRPIAAKHAARDDGGAA